MSKPFIIAISALTVIIVIISIFIISPNSQPTPPSPTTETQSNITKLCAEVTTPETASYIVSCEKAVEKALIQIQGGVIGVSVESIRTVVPTDNSIESKTIQVWWVDIRLANPVFDEEFNQTVSAWRIGIPIDGYERVYKRVLE